MINVSVFTVGLIVFISVGGFSDIVVTIFKVVVGIVVAGVYLGICHTGHGIASSGVPILN